MVWPGRPFPGGNITVSATGFTASKEVDFTLYSKPYARQGHILRERLRAIECRRGQGRYTWQQLHFVVPGVDGEVGLANVTVVSKEMTSASSQPKQDGSKSASPVCHAPVPQPDPAPTAPGLEARGGLPFPGGSDSR